MTDQTSEYILNIYWAGFNSGKKSKIFGKEHYNTIL